MASRASIAETIQGDTAAGFDDQVFLEAEGEQTTDRAVERIGGEGRVGGDAAAAVVGDALNDGRARAAVDGEGERPVEGERRRVDGGNADGVAAVPRVAAGLRFGGGVALHDVDEDFDADGEADRARHGQYGRAGGDGAGESGARRVERDEAVHEEVAIDAVAAQIDRRRRVADVVGDDVREVVVRGGPGQ